MLETQLYFTTERMILTYLNNFQQFLQGSVSDRNKRIGRQDLIDLLLRAQTPKRIAIFMVDEIFRQLDKHQDCWLLIEDVKQQIPHLGNILGDLVEEILQNCIQTFQHALKTADAYRDGTLDRYELINIFVRTHCIPHHTAERIINEIFYNIEMNGNGGVSLDEAWEQILEVADRCINAKAIVEQIVKKFTKNFYDTLGYRDDDRDRKLTRGELINAISRSFRNAPCYYAEQMANDIFWRLEQDFNGRISVREICPQIPQMQYHLVAAVDYVTRILTDNFQGIIRDSACNRSGTIEGRELLNCLIRAGMSPHDANCTVDDIFASFARDRRQYLSLQEVAIELPNHGWRCIYPLQ
ncbi:MAG: hypothetical protein AB4290_27935 [Spirulina sp.]